MAATLSACAASGSRVPALIALPPLPGDLAAAPADVTVREGEDAKLALARTRAGLARCRAQYVDLKDFYGRLRRQPEAK